MQNPAKFSLSFTACLMAAAPGAALAQDSDGDGVPNAADTFPCDAAVSAASFAPAENVHGTMVFEDMWPAAGDLDFNDVVLRYNYSFQRDATGGVRRIRAVFNVTALGGDLTNGLGLHLPVARGAVATITRTVGNGAAQAVSVSSADAELTATLSTNLRELFGLTGGRINSLGSEARRTGDRMVVDIVFSSAVTLSTGGAPFDLYIFRSVDTALEIHRPEFSGTAGMRRSMFNTRDNHSVAGRSFIDYSGLPFALVFPSAVAFPGEGEEISSLYPDVMAFAASGGQSNTNFYATNIATAFAFADATGQGAPSPTMPTAAVIDISCVPVGPVIVPIANGQPWVVPAGVTSVRIEAFGAEGGRGYGGSVGGRGAQIAGTFAVTPGQVLTVVIGGSGGHGTNTTVAGGGGGGGSFISSGGVPMLIAGGGGGGSYSGTGGFGGHGLTTQLGGRGGYPSRTITAGGGGYSDNTGGGGLGAGGGGWLSAGIGNNWISIGGAAAGGAGGPMYGNYGGFGGVGGGGGSMHGGGGGGGYTGGSGGSYGVGGGGGGSYNTGTDQVASAGVRTGAGAVTISY